jgi:ABC-type Mn2+/Zn2+ transport system ATPase subunit
MQEYLIHPVVHDQKAPALCVENVAVGYDGRHALEDISFTADRGTSIAVVGPNGAGKTTLIKVIAGALKPDRGTIQVYGSNPTGHVCIGYVPQRSQVEWSFPVTVAEVVMMGRIRQIGFFRWPTQKDWELVRRSLERVGMQEFRHRPIGDLSGGQQQRVFLAQAVAQEAELLLLDEPLTGLDTPTQEAIFRILGELRSEGVAVLVATHDLNQAAERFDRVMLLNRRLIAYGPPEQVLTGSHLQQAYGGHIHSLSGDEGVMVVTDTCCEGGEEGR